MNRNIIIGGVVALALVVSLVLMKARGGAPVKQPVATVAGAVGKSDDFDKLLQSALMLEQQGELLRARDGLKGLLATYAARPGVDQAQKRLDELNMRIMVSGVQVSDQTVTREVKQGDSLSMIADEYRTTVEFIKKQNGLSSDIIRAGQRLRIWTGRLSIHVDKSQNILVLLSNGEVMKTYRVATGKDNITPVGAFKITNKLRDPSWTHEGKVYAFGTPENILGTRWLGFDLAGYGIHGTTQPDSIGTQATAGCVRMTNGEVEELYDMIPVNTEVTIVD